ncbi:MAG: hypothetical protein AAGA80_20395 [Cyanobacteria bacterium P01_F01_bin.143]
MKFFEQINSHRYLYCTFIGEPEENSLRLELAESKAYGSTEDIRITKDVVISDSRPIGVVSGCSIYQVIFDTYICYNVTNESYAQNATEDEYLGRLYKIYKKSAFLSFIKQSTFATSDYPGPFKHYGFCCLNHIIHVVSCEQPIIVCEIKS